MVNPSPESRSQMLIFENQLGLKLPDKSRKVLLSTIRTSCPWRQHSRQASKPATPAPTIRTEIPEDDFRSGSLPSPVFPRDSLFAWYAILIQINFEKVVGK